MEPLGLLSNMVGEVLWLREKTLKKAMDFFLFDAVELAYGSRRTDDRVYQPSNGPEVGAVSAEDHRATPSYAIADKGERRPVRIDGASLVEKVSRYLERVHDDDPLSED